tara:strand:- start:522 stop:1217 length:696 start_codon:yes stop_codon:yes gene_type:complete
MHELINLFPLTIYKNLVGLDLNERKKLIDLILDMEKKSLKNLDKKEGLSWLGDVNGYENLQLNSQFDKLFNLIIFNIKKYIESLNIDSDQLNIYIQRSWATISRGLENIPPHKHYQSHISFAYYLKKNENDSKISFHNSAAQNEFVPLLFSSPSVAKKNFIKKRDLLSSPIVQIPTKEDEIVIFPSKSSHSTQAVGNNDERISISADISIVVKNSNGLEHLTPPLKNWVKF